MLSLVYSGASVTAMVRTNWPPLYVTLCACRVCPATLDIATGPARDRVCVFSVASRFQGHRRWDYD